MVGLNTKNVNYVADSIDDAVRNIKWFCIQTQPLLTENINKKYFIFWVPSTRPTRLVCREGVNFVCFLILQVTKCNIWTSISFLQKIVDIDYDVGLKRTERVEQ